MDVEVNNDHFSQTVGFKVLVTLGPPAVDGPCDADAKIPINPYRNESLSLLK